ncbi:hypothetical protein BB559_006286 [Furculomyces boomerangus]|uniref:Pyrroline-5-carboxylate reductase n=2 Tax=Harpellales TaxID=61421 RepID=A0A2T9Y3R1_9FUNG|nr:hypothetical protein BB559_006286 [Furculomyces boomerangus]PWA00036.1 hypothetical protein BB558_003871 [Smittium angustum]PWA02463.1 hypothetical protein BB558_001383 [Smittium angustum]
MSSKISFIGGGNIAEAILSGLIKSGHSPSLITVADPYEPQLQKLKNLYKVGITNNNRSCLESFGEEGCDVVIIATKPQIVSVALAETSDIIRKSKPLILSIAAGVPSNSIYKWVDNGHGSKISIVRLMPNTPALIGEGAAGMIANEHTTAEQKSLAESIIKQIAKEYYWFKTDEDIDSVTGISGSGPAYFFYMMEAMQNAASKMGLDEESSRRLIAQTCLGAAKMVLSSDESIKTLRERVTSPNGTTYAAITSMESNNVGKSIEIGCMAAKNRGTEMSEELSDIKGQSSL